MTLQTPGHRNTPEHNTQTPSGDSNSDTRGEDRQGGFQVFQQFVQRMHLGQGLDPGRHALVPVAAMPKPSATTRQGLQAAAWRLKEATAWAVTNLVTKVSPAGIPLLA